MIRAKTRPGPGRIYQIKVTLQGSKPPIWRRLLVPGSIVLGELHDVLQDAMGWEHAHLHRFDVHGQLYAGDFDEGFDDEFDEPQIDEARIRLDQVLAHPNDSMIYEYDFGDDWVHKIVFEKIVDPTDGLRIPRCVAGARACPPEDCGGIWGYAEILRALRSPRRSRSELEDMIDEDFDPEKFDMDEVNERLVRPLITGEF